MTPVSMLAYSAPAPRDRPSPSPLPTGAGTPKLTQPPRLLVINDDESLAMEVRGSFATRAGSSAALRVLGPGAGGPGARGPVTTANGTRGLGSQVGCPAIQTCTDPTEAAAILDNEAPFDLILAGPSTATPAGLERLRLMHEAAPRISLVLAFPKEHRLSIPSVVRTGAIDLVYLPSLPGDLVRAIERATEVGKAARQQDPILQSSASAKAGPLGTVITVASATGGCGKTFLASNLACFFAGHGRRTCILDLDLQFGEVSTALQLKPHFTIADVLDLPGDNAGELAAHFEEYLVRHDTGAWVLAAPRDPSEADRIAPSEVGRVIEVAMACFDMVIVDTPAALTEVVLAAFDRSDLLFAVTTLDTPSIRNLGLFVHTLERLKIPSENVRLVLNKAERDVGIEVDQVVKLFAKDFSAVLPYAREVSRSINVGQPVIASAPGAEISRLLVSAFAQLLDPEERSALEVPTLLNQRRGSWRRWLQKGGGR
jgi:pilus assembly protein CpaE